MKEYESLYMNITLLARLGSIKKALRPGVHKFLKICEPLKNSRYNFQSPLDLVPRIFSTSALGRLPPLTTLLLHILLVLHQVTFTEWSSFLRCRTSSRCCLLQRKPRTLRDASRKPGLEVKL
jgi:hypothetical protein